MLPDELCRYLMMYLDTKAVIHYRCVNSSFRSASRYHTPHWAYIRGPLRYLVASFSLRTLHLSLPRKYTEEDISHLSNLESLKLRTHFQNAIQPSYFKYLSRLTSLDLSCGEGNLDDSSCVYLTRLTHLWLDGNRVTDQGICQLKNLTYLSIHNTNGVSDKGLSALTQLTTLDMYNMYHVTNDLCSHLTNLEDLSMTFGNITHRGVCTLTRLKKLRLTGCHFPSLEGLETLPLTDVSITYSNIHDDQFRHLPQISTLFLFGNDHFTGEGFKYLTNVQRITCYKIKLKERYRNSTDHLAKLTSYYEYDCLR